MSEVSRSPDPVRIRKEDSHSRLMIQASLGTLFDFIPPLVVPANGDISKDEAELFHPVMMIEGQSVVKMSKEIPFLAFLHIFQAAGEQLQEVFNKTGIILRDRHLGNMMLQKSSEKSQIHFDGSNWKLWQIDLESFYDAVHGKITLDDYRDFLDNGFSPSSEQVKITTKILKREIYAIVNSFQFNYLYQKSLSSFDRKRAIKLISEISAKIEEATTPNQVLDIFSQVLSEQLEDQSSPKKRLLLRLKYMIDPPVLK